MKDFSIEIRNVFGLWVDAGAESLLCGGPAGVGALGAPTTAGPEHSNDGAELRLMLRRFGDSSSLIVACWNISRE